MIASRGLSVRHFFNFFKGHRNTAVSKNIESNQPLRLWFELDRAERRKIRLLESNAECRYHKKLTCKGTLRQVFYLSEDPSPPMTLKGRERGESLTENRLEDQ